MLAQTVWGRAWCRHLEQHPGATDRLPDGRTDLRQGAVLDLCVEPGLVTALVAGRALYQVTVRIRPLPRKRWAALQERCAGGLSSVVEQLEGRVGDTMMKAAYEPHGGLFPELRELAMSCSCPDWAGMCKHVAAALYGVGIRLDEQPQLLFELRGVDPNQLVDLTTPARAEIDASRRLEGDLSEIFGIHFGIHVEQEPAASMETGGTTGSGETTALANKISARKKISARSRAWLDQKTRAKKKTTKKKTIKKKTSKKKTSKKKTSKKKTSKKKTFARRRVLDLVITRQQLLARGVPASTIQSWLRRRVLRPRSRRGIYTLTDEALECLEWYG
ncbi:MAG: hypothetical protein AAGF11_22550 [Myxococcota bacterium]